MSYQHSQSFEISKTNHSVANRFFTKVSHWSCRKFFWKLWWCWSKINASVPCGHFLIFLLPRTDGRLCCYYTNTRSIHLKLCTPQWLKHLKCLNDEHTEILNSAVVPIALSQLPQAYNPYLSKRHHPVSLQKSRESAQKKRAEHEKKHHVTKIQTEVWLLSLKTTGWKQRRDVIASEKFWNFREWLLKFLIRHLTCMETSLVDFETEID